MQIRWGNVWRLTLLATAALLVALAACMILPTQPWKRHVPAANTNDESTLYVEVPNPGFSHPYIGQHTDTKGDRAHLHLTPEELEAAHQAAQRAAEAADAAADEPVEH